MLNISWSFDVVFKPTGGIKNNALEHVYIL